MWKVKGEELTRDLNTKFQFPSEQLKYEWSALRRLSGKIFYSSSISKRFCESEKWSSERFKLRLVRNS